MKRTTIGIIAIVLIGIIAVLWFSNGKQLVPNDKQYAAPTEDPIDVSVSLIDGWLQNVLATTSVSLAEYLETAPALTETAKENVLARAAIQSEIDPLLCREETPTRVGGKIVYATETEAQVSVIARGVEKTPQQTLVTVAAEKGEWVITEVACSNGEVGAPIGEFSFVQQGRLVRESAPAPYDATAWHVIFPGVDGSVGIVPLLFSDASQCGGGEDLTTCDQSTFSEGEQVVVKANMVEAGAEVVVLERE